MQTGCNPSLRPFLYGAVLYHINYSIMKTRNHILLLAVLLGFSIFSKAQEKNESPYFVVLSDEDAQAQFPLKTTSVEVDISGVIADVQLTSAMKTPAATLLKPFMYFRLPPGRPFMPWKCWWATGAWWPKLRKKPRRVKITMPLKRRGARFPCWSRSAPMFSP